MRTSSLLFVLSLLITACGGETPGTTSGGGAPGATPFAKPAVGMQIASAKIKIEAGKEQYSCWSFKVPDGEAISLVGIENQIPAAGIHHYAVFTNSEPIKEAGPYSCETMGISWGLVSGGGLGTPGVKFPEGTAMNLSAGQHVVFQLHLINTGGDAIEIDPAYINLVGTTAKDLIPVGLLIAGTLDIALPAHGKDLDVSGSCTLKDPMEHIFSVFPHMHKLGKRISAEVTPMAGGASQMIADQTWDFKDQGLYSVKGSATVGDTVKVTCRYDNPTEKDVNFGLTTSDEMCVNVLYYYPAKTPVAYCGIGG